MWILTRYICAEILKVFLVALSSLTVMFILIGLVREARDQGLDPFQVLQILPYILPDALRFTVPGTILFAACSVYGRMAGANEVVALKSLGISPWAILWPLFALSAFLSVGTVWLNDLAVSWGRAGVRRVVIESVEEIAYNMLRTQRTYATRNFSIIVKQVDERRLIQPTITFLSTGTSPSVTLTAEEAELRADLDKMVLAIVCHNGVVDIEGQGRLRFHDSIEREIPLESATAAGDGPLSPSHMAMDSIPREISEQKVRVTRLKQRNAALASMQLLGGQFGELTGREWEIRQQAATEEINKLYRLQTEPYRRWSSGFSCLCFTLVGAPIAMRLRNSDFLTSFFVCFLPILIVYYPLLALGVGQAKSGTLPPWSVWMGNLLLLGVGLWQMRRVFRY